MYKAETIGALSGPWIIDERRALRNFTRHQRYG